MTWNFDEEIDRKDTGSTKWSIIQDRHDPMKKIRTDAYFGKNRLLPMWVADMDLACPEQVVNALQERARHPVFGYTMPDDDYIRCVVNWMKQRQGWEISPDWIVNTHGVVPALHLLVRAFTSPGQKVLVQRPVYYPFFSAIKENHCEIVSNSLVLEDGCYRMDLEDLENKISDPDVRLAILCSPHNPVGRVWNQEELTAFGNLCLNNNVLVVSDEIHGDLVYPGNTFIPYGGLDRDLIDNSVICTAPSKTFNLAGLQTSNIIIKNPEIREQFKKTVAGSGMFGLNPFGMTACKAAYTQGEEWLDHLLDYLYGNLKALTEHFNRRIPQIPIIPAQGTYLVWFDCRCLGLDPMDLRNLMVDKARVVLDEGYIFGPEGKGFERINIACPRPVLMEAADRIADAIESYTGTSNGK